MTTRTHRRRHIAAFLASAALTSNFGLAAVMAQQPRALQPKKSNDQTISISNSSQTTAAQRNPSHTQSTYMLGPGDSVVVELMDIPEYSGVFPIGPDGTLYLPRLRSITVEGLTIEELRKLLKQKFSQYIRDPQVFVSPVTYRPIRVYVGGEVQRPGYYYLSDEQGVVQPQQAKSALQANSINLSTGLTGNSRRKRSNSIEFVDPKIGGLRIESGMRLPTVFDALRTAGGVTPFSKLNEVYVTRKRSISNGGGKVRAKLNFLELITEGNETQNIRLFDGDTVVVSRSPVELREQIIKAGQTNLSPDFLQVFVTGRVRDPGTKVLPQGASLDQAIAAAGGQKLLRGQVEFIRFNRDGSTDKRKFFIGGTNPAGSYKNPILMAGDVVRINDSPLTATVSVLSEITSPALGIYSVYSLFK